MIIKILGVWLGLKQLSSNDVSKVVDIVNKCYIVLKIVMSTCYTLKKQFHCHFMKFINLLCF